MSRNLTNLFAQALRSIVVLMSPARIFALIIGIDCYKSGNIWNLHSCVEDAKKVKRWLSKDFEVCKDQICLLLDSQASKSNIEKYFTEHLANNPSIKLGDAILIYFAGHGSSIRAPPDWYQTETKAEMVEVLCTYDHDTKSTQGRISGISDRSFHAMLDDLSVRKGNNITVFLDCCFSPPQPTERSTTRWSKTNKAEPDDLYRDLWPTARAKFQEFISGFSSSLPSHVALLSASPGQQSIENKGGGRFTSSFFQAISGLPLHRASYMQILEHLQEKNESASTFMCSGRYRDRILFNGVPFLPDDRFLPTSIDEATESIQIGVGAVQGIAKGTELSLHMHNHPYSRNPPIATIIVSEVQALCCHGRFKSRPHTLPNICWAQMTTLKSRSLQVHPNAIFTSCIQACGLGKGRPVETYTTHLTNQLQVMRVKPPNISVSISAKYVPVKQYTSILSRCNSDTASIPAKSPIEIIQDDIACFNMPFFPCCVVLLSSTRRHSFGLKRR